MALAPGSRLGPYEVLSPLGAGGMGEVYRARDARLGRDVAIKVLPPAFAADAERRARFEREAQTVATLTHPHIVSIFDTGVHDEQIYVVMELLDGETLRERLVHGALPARKATEIAIQIARGLAAAHDKGLVHRDLKPDNIFLLTDGQVKILDFGLARTVADSSSGSGATETVAALTDPGAVMGTVGYMAPEQVRGKAVDARADLFAFGAVLYEMLTGQRAFQRETPADTMTAILKEDAPELTGTRTDLSPALDRIIRHCLEKNPIERFQSARDVAFALEALSGSVSSGAAAATGPAGRARPTVREALAWGVAAVALIAAGALLSTKPVPAGLPAPIRFQVPLDTAPNASNVSIAIAPDGHAMVIQATWTSDDTRLHLRRMDSPALVALPGTAGGVSPFWSPDSRSIAFFAEGKLKRLDLATSAVRSLAPSPTVLTSGTWSPSDIILVGAPGGPLASVPATGGPLTPLGTYDAASAEVMQYRPFFLPDGRRFLYSSARLTQRPTMLGSLDSAVRSVFVEDEIRVIWAGDREVIFRRGDTIYAQAADFNAPRLVGEATVLVPNLGASLIGTRESASDTGQLAFVEPVTRQVQFKWYPRAGTPPVSVGGPGEYTTFDLSNDGTRIASSDRTEAGLNLWAMDTERGSRTRVTLSGASDVDPQWAPDLKSVIFGSTRDSSRSAHHVGVTAGTPTLLWKFPGRILALDDWSRDGRWLIYHDALQPVLEARPLSASGAVDGEPVTVARSLSGIIDQAEMSPDSRWVAYNSNESSRFEIYVVPFPATGARFTVSRTGGVQPTWNGDGSELYFLSLDGELKSSRISASGTAFTSTDPVTIVRPRLGGISAQVEQYAPHPGGTKFLFVEPVGEDRKNSIGVLLNWGSIVPANR